MKLFLPPHAATHHQRFGQRPYPTAAKITADFEICLSLTSFVFLLRGYTSQCCWGREKKKEVGRKRHFWFPQYEHGTVPTPAHSIHQWTHDFCWHPISTDCPASDMGSITPRCHNLIVFIDLCTKF